MSNSTKYVFLSLFSFILFFPKAYGYSPFWGKDGGVFYATQAYNLLPKDCKQANLAEISNTLKLKGKVSCRLWDKETKWKLKWFVAQDDDTAVVVFRGTANEENRQLNKQGKHSAKHRGFEGFVTHQGWAQASILIVEQYLRPYLTESGAKNKRIMVTGHSLGGALAGHVMLRLLLDKNSLISGKNDVMVTTGAPRYLGSTDCRPGSMIKYGNLLLKTGTAAFSAEMWFDETVYEWTNYHPILCTAHRAGMSVNFDPRMANSLKVHDKTSPLLQSVAKNFCSARAPIVKGSYNFHSHALYSELARKYKNVGAKYYKSPKSIKLWPGDICYKDTLINCQFGACVTTTAGIKRCSQNTALPSNTKNKKGCGFVMVNEQKVKHELRHRVEFSGCGGFSSKNHCPPFHHCVPTTDFKKILSCRPKK